MNIYQKSQNQVRAFATNVRCGIGRLSLLIKTLYGSMSAYIQTVINREMPSLLVKDSPKSEENKLKINVWESKGLWYFHVKADNGKIIAASEGYKKKASAMKTIYRLQDGLSKATVKVL